MRINELSNYHSLTVGGGGRGKSRSLSNASSRAQMKARLRRFYTPEEVNLGATCRHAACHQ
jgi:hypothetical protein